MRGASCPTIGRIFFGSWAALTSLGWASRSRPTSNITAASPGRPRRSFRGAGDQRILLEQRGSRKLSSRRWWMCGCRGRFAVGDTGRIELLLDVLNVIYETQAEEGIATDNLYSPNFGQPTVFSIPVA